MSAQLDFLLTLIFLVIGLLAVTYIASVLVERAIRLFTEERDDQ